MREGPIKVNITINTTDPVREGSAYLPGFMKISHLVRTCNFRRQTSIYDHRTLCFQADGNSVHLSNDDDEASGDAPHDGGFLDGSTFGTTGSRKSSSDDSSSSASDSDEDIDARLLALMGGKTRAYKRMMKSIKRNQRKGLDTSRKSKSDSLAIHCLNQMHRACSDRKQQSKVRMSEFFDRPYSATYCVKRDLAITWHPYLALALVEAYLRCGHRSKKPTADALNLEVAAAIKAVWDLLCYREGMAVTERVFDIIDEEDMRPRKLVARLVSLNTVMGAGTLLTHDSVLCHRAPNTCYSHGSISCLHSSYLCNICQPITLTRFETTPNLKSVFIVRTPRNLSP